MLMCPVDRLASFSSGSAMMAEQSAIWAVNIEKCTENDQWPPVIYSSANTHKFISIGSYFPEGCAFWHSYYVY